MAEDRHTFVREYRDEIRRTLGEFPAKITINKLTYIAEDGLPFAAYAAIMLEEEIHFVSWQ